MGPVMNDPGSSTPTSHLSLLIGGARSGKSSLAERLAQATGRPVLFVATMEPRDDEVRLRIAQHRASRPSAWRTVEEPVDVVSALEANVRPGDTIVLDCVTLWVANMLLRDLPDADAASVGEADAAVENCVTAARGLLDWASPQAGEMFAVTNEVGMGVIPPYRLGRVFSDALGRVNAVIANAAGRVYHLNAGLVLELKALGALPVDLFGEAPANAPDL